jgi:hypothetical protein
MAKRQRSSPLRTDSSTSTRKGRSRVTGYLSPVEYETMLEEQAQAAIAV